jgi:hypothetical protein
VLPFTIAPGLTITISTMLLSLTLLLLLLLLLPARPATSWSN